MILTCFWDRNVFVLLWILSSGIFPVSLNDCTSCLTLRLVIPYTEATSEVFLLYLTTCLTIHLILFLFSLVLLSEELFFINVNGNNFRILHKLIIAQEFINAVSLQYFKMKSKSKSRLYVWALLFVLACALIILFFPSFFLDNNPQSKFGILGAFALVFFFLLYGLLKQKRV